jgi:hypothetical protein
MKRKLQGKAPLFLRLAGMLGEPFIAGHVTWRHACRICRRVFCIASRDCGVPLPLAFVVRCVITHEASSLKVRGCAEKSFCRRVGTAGLATDTMFRQPDQYARNRTARVNPRTQGRASARAVALGEELSSSGPQYNGQDQAYWSSRRSLEPRANCWQASEWTQNRGRHGAPLQAVNTTCPAMAPLFVFVLPLSIRGNCSAHSAALSQLPNALDRIHLFVREFQKMSLATRSLSLSLTWTASYCKMTARSKSTAAICPLAPRTKF